MSSRTHVLFFDARFADDVRYGTKRQTLRIERKRQPVTWEKLLLCRWDGKPYASKRITIATATLTGLFRVSIFPEDLEIRFFAPKPDNSEDLSQFIRDDGFQSQSEFFAYFQNPKCPEAMWTGWLWQWRLNTDGGQTMSTSARQVGHDAAAELALIHERAQGLVVKWREQKEVYDRARDKANDENDYENASEFLGMASTAETFANELEAILKRTPKHQISKSQQP